jgi:hypothetical protein
MYDILLKLYMKDVRIAPEGLTADQAKDMLKAFYEALNALDATSSALLIFNGVVITAAAFAAEKEAIAKVLSGWLRTWMIAVIIIGLVASGLCLRVTHISYPFLGKVTTTSLLPPQVDFTAEFAALSHEVALRTCLFQLAWWLSMFAVAVTVLVILASIVSEKCGLCRPRTPLGD